MKDTIKLLKWLENQLRSEAKTYEDKWFEDSDQCWDGFEVSEILCKYADSIEKMVMVAKMEFDRLNKESKESDVKQQQKENNNGNNI
jgi:hypothetical protein